MLHVFENTDRRASRGSDEIAPYITRTGGTPVAVDDRDQKMFEVLSRYGTPIAVPEDLDVSVMCSNRFLRSLLA